MSILAKFNVLRSAQLPPEEVQDQIGIPTHQIVTSSWYISLAPLCAAHDHAALTQAAVTYLQGTDALQDFASLGAILTDTISYLKKKGRKPSATELSRRTDTQALLTYLRGGGATPQASIDRSRIEDTMLALSLIGKLGHKENMNYQVAFRALLILHAIFEGQGNISDAVLAGIMTKPIVLPPCKYNACSELIDSKEAFPHLKLSALQNPGGGPRQVTCNCTCEQTTCQEQNPCCPEMRYYVSDLMLLREDLVCYEPKHLAYIENVMAGETREREHRNLERIETYSETETETTRSQERDHTVEDQFSLKSAVQKTIEQDLSLEAGVEFSGSFGTTKFATHFNASYDLAKSESSQVAQEYARNVTTRAVSKVEEKVRELNSKRQLKEIEETNKHIFTNSSTTSHIIGQYYFVNQKNKAQVMNYGKRMMVEFILPEPMEMYKRLMEKEVLPFTLAPPEPIDFEAADILEAESTDPHSFVSLIKEWGLTGVEPMPDPDIRIPFGFTVGAVVSGENNAHVETVNVGIVPQGYNGRGFRVNFRAVDYDGDNPWLEIQFFVDGQHSIHYVLAGQIEGFYEVGHPDFDATQGSEVTMTLVARSHVATAGSGFLHCELSGQAKMQWKIAIFEKVMAAYNLRLEEFNTAKARHEQEKKAKLPYGRNPFINRDIERTELKRLAINYISCQFFDRFTAMKRKVETCGYPEMDLPQAERDGAFIQFFEQTFEWGLMNYLFYPYFWGQKCSWPEKVQQVSNDPLFDKALAAGAARVQVPVRLGHELLAIYWSYFGEIWMGADQPPVAGSPYYLSMIQEIKEQKNCFYADRPGSLTVTPGSNLVTLTYGPDDVAEYNVDSSLITADIDREILIDCEVYRIVSIVAGPLENEWTIEIAPKFVGKGCCGCTEPGTTTISGIKYHTGAIFVGAPFEVVVPTNLVTLRNPATSDCLPCYPLPNCE